MDSLYEVLAEIRDALMQIAVELRQMRMGHTLTPEEQQALRNGLGHD